MATSASLRELLRQRIGRPALEKLSFNWSAQDTYTDLLNFEMEVTKMLN